MKRWRKLLVCGCVPPGCLLLRVLVGWGVCEGKIRRRDRFVCECGMPVTLLTIAAIAFVASVPTP